MEKIRLSFKDARIPHQRVLAVERDLVPEINAMARALSRGYNDVRASINLPDDMDMFHKINQEIEEKRELEPEYLIVIGIAGSNLGVVAIQEAILGKFFNWSGPSMKVL